MSNEPGSLPPEPDPAALEVQLNDVLDPSQVRRAPRIGAFLTTGLLAGFVVGLVIAGWWLGTEGRTSLKPGVTATVVVVAVTGLGALVAGAWAVIADRRAAR